MLRLTLTEPEAELLREVLEEWLADLRMEISATDSAAYRDGLKARETLLRGILDRLVILVTRSASA